MAESESARTLHAIEMMLPTYMTWVTAQRFNRVLPNLHSLNISCIGLVSADDKVEIDSFIALYDSQGKRATCTQFF